MYLWVECQWLTSVSPFMGWLGKVLWALMYSLDEVEDKIHCEFKHGSCS